MLGPACFGAAVDAGADGPVVPNGFVVDVIAREPLVSNPCVIAFDRLGRTFVAQGPQWRAPTPETPGDRIDILIDTDGDGLCDSRRTFAEGFNCVQGLAWRGDDLWVANAPDLTVVRDTDGDDEADVYIRVYTGLGNLEHSLHGLNFGPDGKLYMSKGNSKGYNRLDQLAPKPFRELWGLPSPDGAPDYTPIETCTKESYRRKYHTPNDDWGQQGGILRCDPISSDGEYGRNLEIYSAGFRNPWDISFDDTFTWLGTDNDQTQGDRMFAPFYGAHFGWGHRWSYHWTGEDHLPTVPNSAPLFEGSGTGVVHYHAEQFPADYRGVFFVNDWMRREIYAFRPSWDGALLKCEGDFPETFARAEGGRSLPASSGRVFEPTDIEVGPDGALYVLSWGHGYGATIENGRQIDAGRVYRIRHAASAPAAWEAAHRHVPPGEWSLDQLVADLGSSVPAWRVAAQLEILRRGDDARAYLCARLEGEKLPTASETWALWTVSRLGEDVVRFANTENRRIQALRIAASSIRQQTSEARLIEFVAGSLRAPEPRVRHEAVLAIHQAGNGQLTSDLVELLRRESDRIVFYSAWRALSAIAPRSARKRLLEDEDANVRVAALLAMLEEDELLAEEVTPLRSDADSRVAEIANSWLEQTGNATPLVEFSPPAGEYTQPQHVTLTTPVSGAVLTYTIDGSRPTFTSPRVTGPIPIARSTRLRVGVNIGNTGGSMAASAEYTIRRLPPYEHRPFISGVRTPSGLRYEVDWTGLATGKQHYTDREYRITSVPKELTGVPYLRTANGDDRSSGSNWLSFTAHEPCELIVGVDVRNAAPLKWMRVGEPGGFEPTGWELVTTDPTFRLYRRWIEPGEVVLGGNTNYPESDSGRGNYIVAFRRPLLSSPNSEPVRMEDVLARMPTADAARGRELFFHPQGAGCVKCHQMEGRGRKFAPDLSDIGSRAKQAQIVIDSILEPSRVITEGFAQQQVVTAEGKVYSGAVLEETGQAIKLVDSKAQVHTVRRSEIEERIGSKVSPMPDGFGRMLTAQQVADIAAWLLTQTVVGDREGFSFRDREERLEIHLGRQRIATYLKEHPRLTRRALVNVTTPGGIQVTRNFPPRAPEDLDPGYRGENGIIHPHMHPGIWIGYGDVDGNDYWRLKAKVAFAGFVEHPTGGRDSGSFAVRNLFQSTDGRRTVCEEVTRYQFRRVPDGYQLRIDAEYRSNEDGFYFGDQEESGLAIRVASPIRVQGGSGTILNDRGERNGAEVWGKEAKWFDYFGSIDGREVGILAAANPDNPSPSWLHARDYGVVVTNPFPKQPHERREPFVETPVEAGTVYRLSWGLLIHERPQEEPLDRERAYGSLVGFLTEE